MVSMACNLLGVRLFASGGAGSTSSSVGSPAKRRHRKHHRHGASPCANDDGASPSSGPSTIEIVAAWKAAEKACSGVGPTLP